MNAVFADTSFYQALLNPRDSWHNVALALSRELHRPIITSEYVLCELGALMSPKRLRPLFLELLDNLKDAPQVKIICASNEYFDMGVELFAERLDKGWSLTDCISFRLMQEQNITEALTADHHFEQVGFTVLLKQ